MALFVLSRKQATRQNKLKDNELEQIVGSGITLNIFLCEVIKRPHIYVGVCFLIKLYEHTSNLL